MPPVELPATRHSAAALSLRMTRNSGQGAPLPEPVPASILTPGVQLPGSGTALDCLPGVIDAADGLPVLFDSGVRTGADVVKALALGGTDGIVHVLRSILAEADLIMAVDGYLTLADLTRDSLHALAAAVTTGRGVLPEPSTW
ncbi:alpha-hydroxy-acid oxidizing protein [Lentzea pudingi]